MGCEVRIPLEQGMLSSCHLHTYDSCDCVIAAFSYQPAFSVRDVSAHGSFASMRNSCKARAGTASPASPPLDGMTASLPEFRYDEDLATSYCLVLPQSAHLHLP
jgi:hypothetical protein